MAVCDTCGNDYDKCIEITKRGKSHTFDCFECAIHSLAPTCECCGCRIIGHGREIGDTYFCCEHCLDMFQAKKTE